MKKLLIFSMICLVLFVFIGCAKLNERVQVADEVSVLMPKDYKKNDMGDGNVMVRSRVGTTDLRVVAINDPSLDGLSAEKLKEGVELNVSEFLKPMQGKLLSRKDSVVGSTVMSDFEFELGNGQAIKHGKGKFILKGNKFITFMLISPTKETPYDKSLQEDFFNSIKME